MFRTSLLLLLLLGYTTCTVDHVRHNHFSGTVDGKSGKDFIDALENAARMFALSDPVLPTLSRNYEPNWNGLYEGFFWDGWWTQNSYGMAYAIQPWVQEPYRTWWKTANNWWWQRQGNMTQVAGGMFVPNGILCDGATPAECDYKQCGPTRTTPLTSDPYGKEKIFGGQPGPGDTPLNDTKGVGKDWIIEGTLSAVITQAENLLVSRNHQEILQFLPKFWKISNFMESRRIANPSRFRGLFQAGPGANLLAPSYGGFPQPVDCSVTGKPYHCTNRAFAVLAPLTVTYTAALERLIQLETLVNRQGGMYTKIYQERLQLNQDSLELLLTFNRTTSSHYFVRSIDPDGTLHGVYGAPKHGYFESAPNHDSIALRVVNDTLAHEIWNQMAAIPQLRPCNFTIANWPDYDDSQAEGKYGYGFGTWVSGGSWSTAEGRMIMGYYRLGEYQRALNSMRQILFPYAALFNLDNPIAAFGCGPGMYAPRSKGDVVVTIDIFGIPGAFIRGLFEYIYGHDTLTLYPRLPPGVYALAQHLDVRWGELVLRLASCGDSGQAVSKVWVNGKELVGVIHDKAVVLPWNKLSQFNNTHGPINIKMQLGKDSTGACKATTPSKPQGDAPWDCSKHITTCAPTGNQQTIWQNVTSFIEGMEAAGFNDRVECQHAKLILQSARDSVVRCCGRKNGTIPGLPPLPQRWKERHVVVNQKKVDDSWDQTVVNTFGGLGRLIQTYASTTAPTLREIWEIWVGVGAKRR